MKPSDYLCFWRSQSSKMNNNNVAKSNVFYISFEPIKVVVASFRRIWLEDKKEHWFFLFFVRNKENCHGVRWYLHFFTLCCSYPRRTHADTLVTNTLNVLKWVWILHATLFFHHRERNEWHRLFWVLIKNNKT